MTAEEMALPASEAAYKYMNQPPAQGPIPLVIGVTGHRDVPDADGNALVAAFTRILESLRRDYPASPMLVLSALAEGADRLAAWTALDFPGTRLAAVLPLPVPEYLRDCGTEASRTEFSALLDAAATVRVVPQHREGNGSTRMEAKDRERQYARVGAEIVAHCHILVAFWDGLSGGVGGTAEVVGHRLHGIPRGLCRRDLLDPVETGPVAHILTPRRDARDDATTSPAGTIRWLFPDAPGEPGGPAFVWRGDPHSMLRHIDRCNRDILALRREDPGAIARCRHSLADTPPPGELPEELETLAQRFAEADAMADRYQAKNLFAFRALLVLGLLLVAQIQLGKWQALAGFLDGFCLMIFLFAFGIYRWARHGRWQERFLDYRGLGEGLRVQFFWRAGGLGQCAADFYMRRQSGDLDWIRQAIRGLTATLAPHHAQEQGDWLAWVKTAWIDGQYRYFAGPVGSGRGGAALRDARRGGRIDKAAGVCTVTGVILTLLWKSGRFLHIPLPDWVGQGCMVLGPLLLALAIGLKAYGETMAYRENSRRYEKMAFLFAQGGQAMAGAARQGETGLRRHVLLEIGREALAENGDWLLQHRARPLKMPSKVA